MARQWVKRCVLMVVVGLAGVAAAQQPSDPSDAVREKFEQGQTLFEQGKFAEAAAEFRAAYAIKPAAALIFNEAVCYERMRDNTKASELFQRYLDAVPNSKDREEVKERIEALAGRAAPAAAKPAERALRGVVFIDSNPPGATIYLDDKNNAPLGTTPWNGTLDGTHTVIVVSKGYREAQKQITGKPGQVSQLYMGLARDEYLGWLEVRANIPNADVFIDGVDAGAVGRTPYMGNLAPGKHTVTVMREGFVEVQRPIEVVAGEVQKVDVVLEEAPIGFVQVGGANLDGARVKLDGKEICVAPCRFRAPTGSHQVSVSQRGQKTYSRQIQIARATETDMQVRLMPKPSRKDVIWKLAVGSALVGVGAFMTVKGGSMMDDVDADRASGMNASDLDDRETKAKIVRYGGYGAMAIGGVALVTGVIGLVAERGPPSTGTAQRRDLAGATVQPRASVVPMVGPTTFGAAATLTF